MAFKKQKNKKDNGKRSIKENQNGIYYITGIQIKLSGYSLLAHTRLQIKLKHRAYINAQENEKISLTMCLKQKT